jgi:hypothetical protein
MNREMKILYQYSEAAAALPDPLEVTVLRKRPLSQIDHDASGLQVLKRLKLAAGIHFKPKSYHSKRAVSLLAGEEPQNANTSHASGSLPNTGPPERPNTKLLFQLIANHKENFNSQFPLRINSFLELLDDYPNPKFPKLLAEIIHYGAKIGYDGPQHAQICEPNHPSASLNTQAISDDINKELSLGRFRELDRLPQSYYCSPLGLVPKTAVGQQTGWRRIFDLSYPKGESINDHINTTFGYLQYETFDEAVRAVATAGQNTILLKRDLKSAFRMIPVCTED